MTDIVQGVSEYIISETVSPSFVVNTALTDVNIIDNGVLDFFDSANNPFFPHGDNVIIEAIRFQTDFAFGNGEANQLGNPGVRIQLGYIDVNTNSGNVTEVGGNGFITVPSFNVDFPLNTFVRQPANVDSDWTFRQLLISGNVSMLNVPASLNATTQRIRTYMKVRHTFPMVV